MKQQTRDVIDAIAAGKRLLHSQWRVGNGKLFITGFSQGGWLAMAVHRALEARGQAPTASMPAAGSYAVSALADDMFLGRAVQGSTIYLPMTLTAARRAGHRFALDAADFFNQPHANGIDKLLPAQGSLATLVKAGRMPATAVFSAAIPSLPADANAQMVALARSAGIEAGREQLQSTYRQGIGPQALVKDSARLAYLEDMATNPDGAWPVWTSGEPSRTPQHPLRRWFARNDLRGWMPRAPLTMCGGASDPAVPFHLNGQLMMRYWSGSTASGSYGPIALLDFDDATLPKDLYGELRAQMAEYQAKLIAKSGRDAMVEAYHNQILPRFCYMAARTWFDTFR